MSRDAATATAAVAVVTRSAWRSVPNALSIARIASAPVLVGLAITRHGDAFTWLVIAALVSDVADGFIARTFHLQSELGAKLDSIGDVVLTLAALAGIWAFHPTVYREHWAALLLFMGTGLLEYLLSLARYGRLSSFHTLLSKTAGTTLAIFVALLFAVGFLPWLFYLAIGLSVLASLEEYVLLALLPEWRTDVRGVYWLWRERAPSRPRD